MVFIFKKKNYLRLFFIFEFTGKLNCAGRWSSPGPKYLLPSVMGSLNHDFTREKKPAYSIGNKWPDMSWFKF